MPLISEDQQLVASMFGAIAAGADDAFIVINENQEIVVFNEASETLFGYCFRDVAGQSLAKLLPPDAAARHHELVLGFNSTNSSWRSMSRRPSVRAVRADGSEFQAAITILKTTTAGSTLFGAIVRDVTGHERADALLQETLTATAGVTGQEFFEKAVQVLAETLHVHTAFIATPIANVEGTSRMIANWSGGRIAPTREFELADTPCSLAMTQSVVHIPSGVHDHFPKLFLGRDKPAAGFLSLRLVATTGEFLGHITLLHSDELNLSARELSSLRVFGSRIAAEIDRIRVSSEIASESDFRHRISESAPFGIAHRNTRTGETWSNESFRRIMGRSYAECREVGWEKIVHPSDLARFLEESEEIRTTGQPRESVVRIMHPTGEERLIHRHSGSRLDSDALPVVISTTVVDMTETQNALAQLERKSLELDARNAELQGSLDAFADIRVRVGADGVFRKVEASAEADLFAPAEFVVGTSVRDYMTPNDAEAAIRAIELSLESGEVTSIQYCWESPSGPRHFEARFAPIAADEVLAVVRDIADIRALESQVVHASTMKSVGLLAGGLAHDFNNVLHIIGGHAAALSSDDVDGNPRIEAITRAVDRGSSLIERLMAVIRPAPDNPSRTIIDDFLETLEPSLGQMLGSCSSLRFDLNAPGTTVLIDDRRLESAMLNLASNARDAMPGGGTLWVKTQVAKGRSVEIRVIDSGVGMTPEVAANVFAPFFTTKSPGVGNGLGLATTYSTIVGANGSIAVETTDEPGSTFLITLPISAPL